ncbi:hypothetical protein ABZ816_17805 [Actinosynnema sp. NPDC047251]|uniref:hypothetical protein n=1 Tax=Saccharothrix espanaensis TaxID=103731 RepID=UPI0002E38EDC|nr:hypothetical protein [Saccharothrix espanaensis]
MTDVVVVTRFEAGSLHAHGFPSGRTAVFPVGSGVEPVDHAVAGDFSRAVYATDGELVCVDPAGVVLWRLDFGPVVRRAYLATVDGAFSADGGSVWLYRPEAMAGRGDGVDAWVVLDAATGRERARAELGTEGHGGRHFAHPDGVHVLLDVGEGQDGVQIYRGRLDGDALDLSAYPWGDRVLVGLSPDGGRFMTVDHSQTDVAFHTWPAGEVVARFEVDAFGRDPDEGCVEWAGGFLDPDTAVVALFGETEDDDEWFGHHLVDVPTGRVLGTLDTPSRDAADIRPLGDGSWLTFDADGRPHRHRVT